MMANVEFIWVPVYTDGRPIKMLGFFRLPKQHGPTMRFPWADVHLNMLANPSNDGKRMYMELSVAADEQLLDVWRSKTEYFVEAQRDNLIPLFFTKQDNAVAD